LTIEKIPPCHIKNYNDSSLVIPTIKERRQYLFDLLNCLTRQIVKPSEVVIVCDEKITVPLETLTNYEELGIKFTFIVVSPELTLGATRNLGIRRTKAKYIYFLDDDTLPAQNWLVEMRESLKKGADVVGGVSEPLFKPGIKKPIWWDTVLLGPYVAVGNQYLKFGYDKIWGCNFAFSNNVIDKIGYFDEDLGMRRSYPKLLAEDSEFFDRAARSGLTVQFNSNAIVYHRLNADRINLANFKKRAWQEGRTIKQLSKKRKSYTNIAFFKVILFKALRGPYFVLMRKSKAVTLPIHMLLLIYEIMGWLGIGRQ